MIMPLPREREGHIDFQATAWVRRLRRVSGITTAAASCAGQAEQTRAEQ